MYRVKDKSFEIILSQNKEKRMKKKKERLYELWDTNNSCIMGVPEGKERGKATEIFFKEVIADNFPNLGRELDTKFMKHTDP